MQRATQFVDEIRSSLEFYTAQTQGARIDRLLISGGGSKLEGFIDILRQRIPVTVEPGRVFSKRGLAAARCPRTPRRRRSRCSRPPSASPSPGAAREPGQPPPAGDPRRPASAPDGGRRGARRHRRDRADPRLLLHPGERAERRAERHRGGGAEQRRVAAGDRGAPGVRGAPRAGAGQAGAPEPGLRQRDLLLRPPDGPVEGDPERRRPDLVLRDRDGPDAHDGRLHAAHGADRRRRPRLGLRHDRVLADAPRARPWLGQSVGDLDRGPGDGTDHVFVGGRPHGGRGDGARPARGGSGADAG